MMDRRRRATREELAQGEEEMKQAEARLRAEAAASNEEAIEDRKSEPKQEEAGKSGDQTNGPAGSIEDKREDPMKNSPNVEDTPKPARSHPPTTPPPSYPPVQDVRSAGLKTPEPGERGRRGADEGKESQRLQTPREDRTGTMGSREGQKSEVEQTPLFTEEQVRALHSLHEQAPWLYQSGRSVFSPYPHPQRPAFLDQEEDRLRELTEKERQLQQMRDRLYQERFEKEELKRSMVSVMEENRRVMSRLSELEARIKDPEPRFATPEGSQQKEAEAAKTAQTPEEDETSKAHEGPGPTFTPEAPKAEAGGNMTEKFMLLMMESMKEMHKNYINNKEEAGMVKGVEVVRSGAPDLPALPQWSPSQGPLQLGDWLLLLEPLVADLSTTSETWWRLVTSGAERWYQTHVSLSPLDRIQHKADPPTEVQQEKWQRLERRVSVMLLQAIPEGIREELVASRRLGVFGILTHLYTVYCPGGVYEKQTLLKNLEEPAEVSAISEAPGAIRKWLRWRRRTEEIGAVAPDPALLLKGLNRLTRRVIEPNKELQFRISMVRNSLGVDTTPTAETVGHFATHLLAELEQVALTEKRASPAAAKAEAPKIRQFEAERGDKEKGRGKGQEKSSEDSGGKPKCHFFLSEKGCRKGKQCTFSHDTKDEKKRCWTCGATDHMSPSCTRPKSASGEGSPTKAKSLRSEGEEKPLSPKESDTQSSAASDLSVKELMEEANRMLRSMSTSASGNAASASSATKEEVRSDVMERLQQQLNSMKMKVLRIGKVMRSGDQGLIDSGATHPLRPARSGENITAYKQLQVTLADGGVTRLPMSPGGAMVSPKKDTEPIVPMGQLTELLGCEVKWKGKELELNHPKKGLLPVYHHEGCPQVSKALALELIEEIEDKVQGIGTKAGDFKEEEEWMKRLAQEHPVLSKLPPWIKDRLAVTPGEWSSLPLNRKWRKRLKREGFILHLYAGGKEGFTLQRAFKQVGGDEGMMLEVDEKRGSGHDMLSDSQVYPSLLRAALEGKLKAILGGPNCRTRSVLRHFPVEGNPDAPRPVREWGGGEFGKAGLTPKEEAQVRDDDLLLWRMIYLYMVAHYMAQARGLPKVHFALEQPASPHSYMPETVSFWDTEEWKQVKEEFQLEETTFEQKSLGGPATKPTTIGGSLKIDVEDHRWRRGRSYEKVSSSKDLARWPPGLMHMIATALQEQVLHQDVQLKALSWQEHIAFNHIPYRRDCRVCQESLQQADTHHRVRNPMGGILSLDVAGPMKPAYDQGGGMARWFLAGALTWRVPKGTDKMKQPIEEPLEEDAPAIEAADEEEPEDQQPDEAGEGRGGREDPDQPPEA